MCTVEKERKRVQKIIEALMIQVLPPAYADGINIRATKPPPDLYFFFLRLLHSLTFRRLRVEHACM